MGIFRKATSISSMGLVPYRSKKEKLARAPLQTNKYLRRQNAIGGASLFIQAKQFKRTPPPPPPPWQQ